mmetsp:Transcript_86763/g.232574  ORF Transcript_86763/g.232574 Transcript_86763/m.232574 type:complete len:239 (+) Transcript_86763:28-744(+)
MGETKVWPGVQAPEVPLYSPDSSASPLQLRVPHSRVQAASLGAKAELGPHYTQQAATFVYPCNGGLSDDVFSCTSDGRSAICSCVSGCSLFHVGWRYSANVRRLGGLDCCGRSYGPELAVPIGVLVVTLSSLSLVLTALLALSQNISVSAALVLAILCSSAVQSVVLLLFFAAVRGRLGLRHGLGSAALKACLCPSCFLLQLSRHVDRVSGHLPVSVHEASVSLVGETELSQPEPFLI